MPYITTVAFLGKPNTSRQLAAGVHSTNTALSSHISRVSMRATGADIRFEIGEGTQYADAANSHFIAEGERLDFSVHSGANIAVIRDGTDDGVLELTELH